MKRGELPLGVVIADTATKLGADARGAVIVTGSHGGRYAAYLTLSALPRAVIHNDAGIGKDEAGIAVLAMAEALGVPAATASHASCSSVRPDSFENSVCPIPAIAVRPLRKLVLMGAHRSAR